MNSLDFVSGIDFTGYPSIQGADINVGIANGIPLKDIDETVGKGICITTTDSALNTPVVPNPLTDATYTKWKRYLWVRRPFPGAAVKSSKIYIWNEDADNDAIYLRWLEVNVDLTAITASVNNALATSNAAVAVADVANNTANAANNTANAASVIANAANTTAVAANTLAGTANTTANTALTAANAAQVTATQGVNLNTTPIDPNQRLTPSATAYQILRTKGDASGVEWYSRKAGYTRMTEVYAKGTDNPTAAVNGKNTRLLNNIDSNYSISGVPNSLNPVTGVIGLHVLGLYRIKAWAIINRSGTNTLSHQLLLVKDFDNSTLLTGASFSLANGNTNNVMAIVEGVINVAVLGDLNIRLDHYTSTATGVVLGKAANVHPDAGGNEVYSGIEIEFLGN